MLKSGLIFVLSGLFFLIGFSQKQVGISEIFKDRGEVYFRFKAPLDITPETMTKLVSVDRRATNDGLLYAYANQKQFAAFLDLQIDYEILPAPGIVPNVEMQSEVDIKQITDWDFYPTYEAYIEMMYQFQEDYPDLCEIVVIGESIEGRELIAVRISDNVGEEEGEPKFLYTATMHGDETAGYPLMLRLINYLLTNYGIDGKANIQVDNLVNSLDIFINPLANTDGTYHGGNSSVNGATRYNANNIDLNRNYPDPEDGQHPDDEEWQQETIAFMQFAEDYQFTMSANFHGGAEVFNYPWDTWPQLSPEDEWWQMVAHEWADTAQFYSPPGYMTSITNSGVTNGYAWYTISGGRQDYMNYFRGCLEATLEISNTKLLPANQLPDFWEYNYRSFLNYLDQAIELMGSEDRYFDDNISIVPNPSNGLFYIIFENDTSEDTQVAISNISGNLILEKNIRFMSGGSKIEIDLGQSPAGVYFVKLQKGDVSVTKTIIID
ncbi:MAG: hypothetical protein DRJ05_08115 [Bacteroidetes bacterium]|nr:MAG: hypothetical protein DRJ05_08115 [Bacteroidota bacterium]